jgi:hypothetical protein
MVASLSVWSAASWAAARLRIESAPDGDAQSDE